MLSVTINSFIENNKLRFEVMNEIVRMNVKMRTAININQNVILIIFQLLYVDIYAPYMDAATTAVITGQIREMQATLNKVYNTTALLSIFIDTRENNLNDLANTYERFLLSTSQFSSYDSSLSMLADYKVKIGDSGDYIVPVPPFNVSPLLEAITNTIMKGRQSLQMMKIAEPYMIGKEPPFNMPPDIRTTIIRALQVDTSAVNATAGYLLGGFKSTIETIAHSILKDDLKEFTVWIIALCGIQILLNVLGTIIFIYFVCSANKQLGNVLLMYQLLKVNEVRAHIDYYSSMIERLKKSHLNELKLIEDFKSGGVSSFNVFVEHRKKIRIAKSNKRLSRTEPSVIFKSTTATVFSSLTRFVIFGVHLLLLVTVSVSMLKVIPKEQFYFDNYKYFAAVSDNYLSFALLASVGNFIKIDGKYPDQVYKETSDAIHELTNFWLNNQSVLDSILKPADAAVVNSLLYSDIFPYLPQGGVFEESTRYICRNHLPSRKGILAFFMSEQAVVSGYITNYAIPQTDYLESSKEMFQGSLISPTIFQPDSIAVRALHDPIFELFNGKLFEGLVSVLTQSIAQYSRNLTFINLVAALVFIISHAIHVLGTKKLASQSKLECFESSYTIRPETLSFNPLTVNCIKGAIL